jgi:hypothetical protein
MALGALLAAAEWRADSGADIFGHPIKQLFQTDFRDEKSVLSKHTITP